MKMQNAIAAKWLGNLPPVLSRMFAARDGKSETPESGEAETAEVPHSRWTWKETSEDTRRWSKLGIKFTRRPGDNGAGGSFKELPTPEDCNRICDQGRERRAASRLVLFARGPSQPVITTPWRMTVQCGCGPRFAARRCKKTEGIMAQSHRQVRDMKRSA